MKAAFYPLHGERMHTSQEELRRKRVGMLLCMSSLQSNLRHMRAFFVPAYIKSQRSVRGGWLLSTTVIGLLSYSCCAKR